MTVYVVTSGLYSDYGIDCVFVNKEKAEKYVKLRGKTDSSVHPYETYDEQFITEVPFVSLYYHPYKNKITLSSWWGNKQNNKESCVIQENSDSCLHWAFFPSQHVLDNINNRTFMLKLASDKYAELKAHKEGIT